MNEVGPIKCRSRPYGGRSAESLRVLVTQDDREVADASACIVADVNGPSMKCPAARPYGCTRARVWPTTSLKTTALPCRSEELRRRPVEHRRRWPPPGPQDPVWRQWHSFAPTSTFDDPWTDAARYVLCDLPSCLRRARTIAEVGRSTAVMDGADARPVRGLPSPCSSSLGCRRWQRADSYGRVARCNVRLWSPAGQSCRDRRWPGYFCRVPGTT